STVTVTVRPPSTDAHVVAGNTCSHRDVEGSTVVLCRIRGPLSPGRAADGVLASSRAADGALAPSGGRKPRGAPCISTPPRRRAGFESGHRAMHSRGGRAAADRCGG